MIFRRKQQKPGPNFFDWGKPHYDRAIEVIYRRRRITLAIARAEHWDGVDVHRSREASDHKMIGVVDGYYGGDERMILCEIEFYRGGDNDERLGRCVLTHGMYKGGMVPLLEVNISNRQMSLWGKARDALRDAAISGNRFCHFRIGTEIRDEDAADAFFEGLREGGSAPEMAVTSFELWPQITLPNAPSWGWNRD
jgi:hypothetical protein